MIPLSNGEPQRERPFWKRDARRKLFPAGRFASKKESRKAAKKYLLPKTVIEWEENFNKVQKGREEIRERQFYALQRGFHVTGDGAPMR